MRRIRIFGVGFLIALGCALLLPAPSAQAQAPACAVGEPDTDEDGFCDAAEQAGITLVGGQFFAPCPPGTDDLVEREMCVDFASADVFVMLRRASPSLWPADPLRLARGAGVPFTPHGIDPAQVGAGRQVSPQSEQRAIDLQESLDVSGTILGEAEHTTPNGAARGFVYTQRVINFVNSLFDDGADHPEVYVEYIDHVSAHEVGHMLLLEKKSTRRLGGNHTRAGTGCHMDQAVSCTAKKNTTPTCDIPMVFCPPDDGDATYR